ncbi:AbrB/MazE/SpoVT family DNA-binding domain-containing protein [Moorella naiadis (nom. illeg.)]|uniref:AbrB/MazE/SpoVT family DNA-binding domain-containing protein n=1 Tax=Moorella naiadis (nom. illeg.) TaxID=3093670 RepID=UPI003D9C9459
MSHVARISRKGWVVIPKELRQRYNISPGAKVVFAERDGSLFLTPVPPDPIASGKGLLRGYPLVETLLAQRKEEVKHEEIRF